MRWQMIDKILECAPGLSAVGEKIFPPEEPLFLDHFPGFPIVPGVLQIEMMAQLAGKCAALSKTGILPVLGSVKNARFYHNVHPGERCLIKVQVLKVAKSYIVAEGEIEVNGKKASSASILFGVVERSKLSSDDFDSVSQDWLERQS